MLIKLVFFFIFFASSPNIKPKSRKNDFSCVFASWKFAGFSAGVDLIIGGGDYTTSDTVFFITRSEGNFMDLIFGLALDSGGFAPASMMQMDENEQRQSVAGECENIMLSCSRMHSF